MLKHITLHPDQQQQELLASDEQALNTIHDMLVKIEVQQTRVGPPYRTYELMDIVDSWRIQDVRIRSLDIISLHRVAKNVGKLFTGSCGPTISCSLPGNLYPIAVSLPTFTILPGYVLFQRYGAIPAVFSGDFAGKITRATIIRVANWTLELTIATPKIVQMHQVTPMHYPTTNNTNDLYDYDTTTEEELPTINDFDLKNQSIGYCPDLYFGPNDRLEICP